MHKGARMLAIPFIYISILFAGCSTVDTAPGSVPIVQKTVSLSPLPQTTATANYKVSSLLFTGPRAGAVVFSYADVTPPMYASSMMIPGGAKRADVIYTLENDLNAIISKALSQVFSIDSAATKSVSGQVSLQYSDITPLERKGSSSSIDVAIDLLLDLEVGGDSSIRLKKRYTARNTGTSSGLLITFPSNSFLNSLFANAFQELLVTVKADSELATAMRR